LDIYWNIILLSQRKISVVSLRYRVRYPSLDLPSVCKASFSLRHWTSL